MTCSLQNKVFITSGKRELQANLVEEKGINARAGTFHTGPRAKDKNTYFMCNAK